MIFSIKKVIIRRTLELVVSNMIISLFLTMFNVLGVINTKKLLGFGSLFGVAIFMLLNIKMSRNCYFDLRSNHNYYFSNILSYLFFVLIGILVYLLFPGYIFTWLFSIIKVAKYSRFVVSTFLSMLYFHTIGFLCILFAPIGMGWVFEINENDFEE